MNQGLYKLVFSSVLNAYVPVSEAVCSHGNKSGKRVRKLGKQVWLLFLFVGFVNTNTVLAETVLPAGLSVKTMVGTEISNATANSINFNQLVPKAIVDWNTLNLNAGHSLNVNMQRSWSMLNRIHDINPSVLNGNVNAAGNLYFINTNGIIFGANANFNVGSLYAGTLDIKDELFKTGFVGSDIAFAPVFELAGVLDSKLEIEAGAKINAAPGGKVLLFSENIENSGIINTPDGQTILAAGKKVYLANAINPDKPENPVGFLVEVDSGGTATNLGKIIAERGNITIAGLAVNQQGTLTATTSVRANGSIYLQAQDKVIDGGQSGSRDGTVTLAKGSITQVTPELDNLEEITKQQAFKYAGDNDSGKLKKSEIKIEAAKINIDGKVLAKSGTVTAKNADELTGTSIFLGTNAVIDVSGVDAIAPMSRNQLSLELFSGELADNPILRDGPLFRQRVFIDARKGANGFIDTEPFEKISKVTIAEALTKGGTIKLSTLGDVVVNKGAVLDVSGGSTTYSAGNIIETNLSLNGKLVPISEAKKGVAYDRAAEFYIDKDNKTGSDAYRFWDLTGGGTASWGEVRTGSTNNNLLKTTLVGSFVDEFFNGDDAGTFDATAQGSGAAANLVLDGTVIANTKTSLQQIIAGNIPKGGEFKASANQLVLAKAAKEVTTQFGDLLDAVNYASVISTEFLSNGFNRIDLSKTNSLVVDEDLLLKPNGSLTLSKFNNTINANIIALGSSVSAAAVTIADNVTISTAGEFTNDKPGIAGALSKVAVINAGSISLGNAELGKNVTLDASAGAHVNAQAKFKQGTAGNISFSNAGALDESTTLQAYGFKKGGELTLGFADILNTPYTLNIAGNATASDTDIDIDNAFFSKGGFSKVSLSAAQVNIGGASNAPQKIYAAAQTWRMNEGASNLNSAQNMSQVATPFVQPDITRAPVSFGFSASYTNEVGNVGIINLAENTTIRTDGIGGSVSLAAGKQVNVLGDIVTPSGNINISINDKSGSLPYDATQAIFIGEKSSLTALATSQTLPDSTEKLFKTQIFNAGNINIDAPKGSVIIKSGAQLDVSSTSIVNDTQTVNGFVRETLHADAGSIKIGARDGLKLDGTFIAKATGTARKGNLEVGSSKTAVENPTEALPSGNREFTITQQKQLLADNVRVGDALKTDAGEIFQATNTTDILRRQISAQQIIEGGFDNVSVNAGNSAQLQNGLDLAIAGNFKIESPIINVQNDSIVAGGGSAKLTAGHVTLNFGIGSSNAADVVAGDNKLTINAKQLFLDGGGQIALTGVNKTEINTTLDIHGQGGIMANGDIKLTARQIYPNSKAEGVNNALRIEAIGENSKISINSSGTKAKPILSAQGTLTFKADEILQAGVLSAPFGTINLEAKNAITLAENSITSVSADKQIIPYLQTRNVGKEIELKAKLTEKGVNLSATNIDVKQNAVIDLSATGALFATEFVPGAGGSKDILGEQANTYAVIPNFGQEFAPAYDVFTAKSPAVNVGDSVFLTGINGLPTGNYTLLPARYALVPGAFVVEVNPASGKLSAGDSFLQLDGTGLTSGYRADLATGARDANWSTFKITDGAVFRTPKGETSRAPAQYQLTNLTEFFSNPINTDDQKVPLPIDVGRLSLSASSTLALDGQVIATKGKDAKGNFGDGLQVDISAEKIRLVSSTGAADGSLQLTANSINALNADSVLLGGTNKLENGINKITTVAQTVSIENNAANVINTPELIVTALDTLTVKTGAAIDTGAAAVKPNQKTIETTGNSALLALSSKNAISYSRVDGTANATNGELNIETGSTLKAGNALVVDATKATTLGSNPVLQDGATAYFGANRILLGNAPTNTAGLNLTAAAVAALGQLKALTLSSYNNLDIFGAFNLGNANLDLTVNAAGIAGNLANGETAASVGANATPSVITANTFTLKNTTNAAFSNPANASGRDLQINAATVRFEGKDATNTTSNSGKTQIAGFNNLTINADEVRVAQTGELILNLAKTTVNTGRVTGETGEYAKNTDGVLIKDTTTDFKVIGNDLIIAKLATAKPSINKNFGAKVNIEATNLTVATDIDLASGQLILRSDNNLNIENGANITAKSSAKEFYNITKDAPAGSVTLASLTGNVNVNAGAVVDVTSQGEANAGTLKVLATAGTANIAGDLKGAATGTGKGGVLEVDVNTLAGLSITDKQAKGFDETRQYRVRTGDVAIIGKDADALKARQIGVFADAGRVIVSGEIIATAPKNSRIDVYGNKGVTLTSTAILKANSTQAGEEGGKVNIGSTADVTDTTPNLLNFVAGSMVDVSGGAGGKGGEVNIIAPRTSDNTDVEIERLDTNFVGVEDRVKIVGKSVINTALVDTANRDAAIDSANSFMSSVITDSTKGLQRLGLAKNPKIAITPGVEFRNEAGGLELDSDWSLYDWRYDPTTGARVTDAAILETGKNVKDQTLLAGVLSLRARDNVSFTGTLSDGFSSASLTEVSKASVPAVPEVLQVLDENGDEVVAYAAEIPREAATGVQGIESWAYNIVAGADFTAANPLATSNNITGNVSLANNKGIRTGTGDINVAAAGDLNMLGTGSVIYTAGRAADTLDGFVAPIKNNPLYLTDGGDISVLVKGNIKGAEPLISPQLINNYLFRDGSLGNIDTTWWVRPDLFKQSLATLGGGDVNIAAGGNVSNFSAILPTTARFDNVDVATGKPTGKQVINGGGDLTLNVAGNLNGGVYLVAKGNGEINTGGSIEKPAGNALGTVLALQDGTFNVQSRKNQYIEAIINPTLFTSSKANAGNLTDVYFNSYSDTASVNLSSLLANIELGEKTLRSIATTSAFNNDTRADGYLPSSLNAVAFNGDIATGRESTLLPSATGGLELLAANNIIFKNNLSMSDADPALFANALNPDATSLITSHANSLLHKNDTKPALIVAQTGNIEKNINGAPTVVVSTPKFTKVVAGKDIKDVSFNTQNNNASDISVIRAGEDVEDVSVGIAGPGELLMQASRNIDLANNTQNIIATGKNASAKTGATANLALPDQGALITLQAGLGKDETLPNVQGYIDQYILPAGTGPTNLDAAKLAEYRVSTSKTVTDFIRNRTGNNSLDDAQALAQFNLLDLEAKTIFANRHLSSELVAAAVSNADARGFAAIAKLFPKKNVGDILMFKSKISTNSNGSIDFIVPNGEIIVGTTGSTSDGTATSADIGVLTRNGGDIRMFANGDIQINNSKVITQAGGDIIMYSDNGNIDAGKGSKTATSSPETFITTDADGNTTIEVIASSAGSGIRTDSTDPDGPSGPKKAPKRGDVKLITPRGFVDASEGGIAANNLFLRALTVLNADNIQVQGVSSGTPLAAASSLAGVSVGLSPDAVNAATASVAQSVAQSAGQQTFVKPVLPSIINVEVISIGN